MASTLNAPNNEASDAELLERATIRTAQQLFFSCPFKREARKIFTRLVDFSIENTTQETCPKTSERIVFPSHFFLLFCFFHLKRAIKQLGADVNS